MATTQRINVADAIQKVAYRTARERTALSRIGTITTTYADGTVDLTVGGSTFTAVSLVEVAVNDVVVALADTDAWWVLGRLGTPRVKAVARLDFVQTNLTGTAVDIDGTLAINQGSFTKTGASIGVPRTGLYRLQLSNWIAPFNGVGVTTILANGADVGSAVAFCTTTYSGQAMCGTVVSLNAGQTVKVQGLTGGGSSYIQAAPKSQLTIELLANRG